jgi:hypothetical protein
VGDNAVLRRRRTSGGLRRLPGQIVPAAGARAVIGQRPRALTPGRRPRLGQVDRIRQRPLLGQVGEVVAHTYAASRPGTPNPGTTPGAQAAWGERFGVGYAGAAWGVCHA